MSFFRIFAVGSVSLPIIQNWRTSSQYFYFVLASFIWKYGDIYSRLSRSFTARGFSSRDPTKGIRLISLRVTKLPQRYIINLLCVHYLYASIPR